MPDLLRRPFLPVLASLVGLAMAGYCSSALAVDAREAGLTGNGATDDTAALQAALDGGKTNIEFPQGEYLLGPVKVPADTMLSFDPKARIKVAADKVLIKEEYEHKPGLIRTRVVDHPLFQIVGDRVTIRGLRFDFTSGAMETDPTPVSILIRAEGVSDVTVQGVYVENTYPVVRVPLEKRQRFGDNWEPAPGAPKEKWKNECILFEAEKCRNVVLENSGARQITHMLRAEECANVTSRGNWLISGGTITTFAQGSESLRHYDNWSRDAQYQVVWRGGSPDPSRKAPQVPLGTANVVKRGVEEGAPDFVPHTQGVFDVIVSNNYAEYGVSLAWGNKGRQVVVEGNIARFIADYAFGSEGGQNLIFANNICINSTSGAIVSMYWGENLLITGNLVLVRHEPMDTFWSRFPSAAKYLGGFVRLHHGPSNPEDRYGAGTTSISDNLFVNELATVTKNIDIQSSRDVTVRGNKIINGAVRKGGEEKPGEGKVTVLNNEFISRQEGDVTCISAGSKSSVTIVRGNVFRKEKPVAVTTEAQKLVEKEEVPYIMYAEKPVEEEEKESKTPDTPEKIPAAIRINVNTNHFALIQNNLILGWNNAINAMVASRKTQGAFVITGNTADGAITVDDPEGKSVQVVKENIQAPPSH